MKQHYVIVFCIYLFAASIAFATINFPTAPDLALTPGAVCSAPNDLRYPEKIPYCDRDVNRDEKWLVIANYMKKFDFTIDHVNRDQFKIDHYIPLCMGGANTVENLWPQHQTVYSVSDPLEVALCERLAKGIITQKMAIEKIKEGKLNYKNIPQLILEIEKIR